MENILEIASLDVRFEQPQGQLRALRGIDLEVKKGEVLCIVGESGCGKSVLCKTIANVLCKEGIEHAGTITYDGIDLLAMPEKKRRRLCAKDMALVLQDPHTALDPRMKIGRQLDEVLKKYEKKLSRKERTQKLIEMLEQVEIDHPSQRMEQYPYMLSGGMKQRIVIAQALLKRPRILLADEPTAALDPSVSKVVLDLLKKINTSHHITIILVVHDLAAAYHYAHRVAVMYAGKVVEYGTKEDVFETPLHPYTKALLRSLPGLNKENRRLETIEGSAPLIYEDIRYDAFACRNKEADPRDFVEQASMSQFTKTHFAAVRRGNEDV